MPVPHEQTFQIIRRSINAADFSNLFRRQRTIDII